jgi:hypothetical protein
VKRLVVDRHHSGLFRSMQLLGQRLGIAVYAPVGQEWWDEGIWNFGRYTYGDDRLARQFLYLNDAWQRPWDGSNVWESIDSEFPDAPVMGVPLDIVRSTADEWAFVVASVPDNEDGFARLAREIGAQLVVQVGNTGQYTNWGNDPLALVSSEMPILGRGIRYHQEMEPVAFAPVIDHRRVGSFVNCMSSMGRCWDLLAEYDRLADWAVDVYGIDGNAGIVKPYSELVGLMATYGWGWHDKAQGDGFGHVIHSWAAVGRPLIGHASHYRGRMAEPFWQDGVTCLDLDRHSVAEVVDIVRTMHPDDHERMCRAIRAEFDRAVDYDAEAAAIADFLGVGQAVAA